MSKLDHPKSKKSIGLRVRLYAPNLKDVDVLESAQSRSFFTYTCLYFFPLNLKGDVWEIKSVTSRATTLKFVTTILCLVP